MYAILINLKWRMTIVWLYQLKPAIVSKWIIPVARPIVWERSQDLPCGSFFEKKTDKTVTCMVCSTTLQYHGGTSSMKEHLKQKHPGDNPFEPSDEKRKQSKLGKALESEHGWVSHGCAGHTLKLCVNADLQITAIKNAVAAGRRLITHFRKSEPALRALRSRQKDMRVDSHNLIQDISTRWNSTYYMMEHLIEQRWPITAVLSDHTVTKASDRYLDLKSEQWELLTALKEVLHPLQVATTYFSAKYNVSVSALYPVLHGLLQSLEPSDDDLSSISTCKTTISSEIRRRHLQSLTTIGYGDNFKELPLIACIVDSRFKWCKFLAAEKHVEIKAALTGLVC